MFDLIRVQIKREEEKGLDGEIERNRKLLGWVAKVTFKMRWKVLSPLEWLYIDAFCDSRVTWPWLDLDGWDGFKQVLLFWVKVKKGRREVEIGFESKGVELFWDEQCSQWRTHKKFEIQLGKVQLDRIRNSTRHTFGERESSLGSSARFGAVLLTERFPRTIEKR